MDPDGAPQGIDADPPYPHLSLVSCSGDHAAAVVYSLPGGGQCQNIHDRKRFLANAWVIGSMFLPSIFCTKLRSLLEQSSTAAAHCKDVIFLTKPYSVQYTGRIFGIGFNTPKPEHSNSFNSSFTLSYNPSFNTSAIGGRIFLQVASSPPLEVFLQHLLKYKPCWCLIIKIPQYFPFFSVPGAAIIYKTGELQVKKFFKELVKCNIKFI